ncbi:MAG: ribonuclease H-like domain-containing protein [Sedimenticolaceae bacterium]
MNLASRLDRLRGQAADPGSEPLAQGIRRARRHPGTQASLPARFPVLAEALGADCETDGLLVRRREYTLSGCGLKMSDLSSLPEVCDLHAPDWVYIDTETTGLSGGAGNLAFMVGAARYTDERRLEVRQYVLGSFASEARMLRELFDWVGSDAVLVSYNGKCFDLPLLIGRLRMHRINATPGVSGHLDLMYSVRRAYRRHWPDCRLQTAERRLLGLSRVGDLPGAEAPAAWQSWLREGDTRQLLRVLEHNYQDVVSLALLHQRLPMDYAGSGRADLDHAAIGRAWRDAGRDDLARRVWEFAGSRLDANGSLQLARLYRQQRQWRLARAVWQRLHARGNAEAALELSKYYEHRRRDYQRALGFLRYCEGPGLAARYARLQDKVECNLQLPLLPLA